LPSSGGFSARGGAFGSDHLWTLRGAGIGLSILA
jgi:hypothetical protein